MAVQGPGLRALVFGTPKPLGFRPKPCHGRAFAFCRFVSRWVWFGFVSRVEFLCSSSPFPHCTMLSHPPQCATVLPTNDANAFLTKLCVRLVLGWGSRWTRPVPEGTGQGSTGALQPPGTPVLLLGALTSSRTQREPRPPSCSVLFVLCSSHNARLEPPLHNGLANVILATLPRKALGELPSCL